jgi:transposase-like protein
MSKRKKYSPEFKAEAVRQVESRGTRTVLEVAQSLGVSSTLLHGWRKPGAVPVVSDRGESPEEELRRLRREKRRAEARPRGLAKIDRRRREDPGMSSFELVRTVAAEFPVRMLCALLGVSSSGLLRMARAPAHATPQHGPEAADQDASRARREQRRLRFAAHAGGAGRGWRVRGARQGAAPDARARAPSSETSPVQGHHELEAR